ncbi:hypothetical protein [Pleurocapsa sp. PCC 7319]|uniref:hypothetical protein n=1 Tax=Pleurocapsa sp. PCC 7319 TaxID=118161 RepID=UPI0003479647|nr:hypothetical protein [Pleurocapsa sp. PCC 7319]
MNKLLLGLVSSIIFFLSKTSIAQAQSSENLSNQESNQARITFTPLAKQLFSQPTAQHLGQGEVLINLNTRTFFFPDLVENGVDDNDSAVNFNTGFSWGITDDLQLTLQFQHVDSSSPVRQGEFTSERTEDNEAALELKQRLWSNQAQTQSLSGVLSASWGTRGFMFTRDQEVTEINNRDIFVSLAVPFSASVGDRWEFNLSPTLAFFKDESAVFFHRLPDDDESSFGTVLGLGGGVSYRVNSRLSIFGDVFFPLTGNNSINRDSGDPDKAIAYNAGLRYLTNPRLALDVYASNTFASYAPLSLTADRDFMGLGANLVFMPDVFKANRRYGDSFQATKNETQSLTTDGLGFFDGGTLPSGKFAFQLQGGSQGVLTALRFGLLKDFEAGIFLDYVAGEIDESEQGISGKVRFLNQEENAPVTLSVAATASLTNEPFINFIENDTNAFERFDLNKSVPFFTPGGDERFEGKLIIFTISLPIHYEISKGTAVWATPILGYVQRQGLEIGGFNLGTSIALSSEINLIGEVGVNFAGEGNAFIDGQLEDKIPWSIGARWTPLSLLNREAATDNSDPYLELFLTNRVGSSTWHQLRVRENNEVGVGVGLSIPFSF